MTNDANYKNVRLRWLGTPGILACIAGAVGACSSDQSLESIGYADQAAEASTVLLSEIQYRPNTTAAYRYIELTGTPSGTLEGYYVLFVDGRATGVGTPGSVLKSIDLGAACSDAACAFGTNGMLVIVSSATGGFTYPSATTVVVSGFTMPGNIGAGTDDYSVLLVKSTAAIATGADVDSANNGTLTLPAGATLVDAVGWTESASGGHVYGGADVSRTGAGAQSAPQTIIRIDGVTTANSVNAWFTADTADTGAATIALDTTTIRATGTTAAPTGVTKLTPGLANTAANVALEGTAGAAGAAGASSASSAGHAGSSSVMGGGTAGTTYSTTAGTTSSPSGGIAGAGTTIVDAAGTAGVAGASIVVVINGGSPSTGGASPTGGTTAESAGAPPVTGGAPATGGAYADTAGAPANLLGGAAGLSSVLPGGGTPSTGGQPSAAGQGPAAAGNATTTGGSVSTGGTKATGGATVAASGSLAKTGGSTSTTVTNKAGATGASKGGATSTGATGEEEEESSCSCRVAGKHQSTRTGLVAMLALAGAVLSRRRRRS